MQTDIFYWKITLHVSGVHGTPDDGCGGHPKHVERFCSKINQIAYCCI